MGKQDFGANIIRQIAERRGVTPEEIRKELEKEILRVYNNNVDGDKWNKIFGAHVIPTPEEFITKMGQVLKKI